jgi:hypothetical protein
MTKLKKIKGNDLQIVNNYFKQCTGNTGRQRCPSCNKRHSRLPNPKVFALIINKLEHTYTNKAFADVWGVSREAVRLLWGEAFSNTDKPITQAEYHFGSNVEEQITNVITMSRSNLEIKGDVSLTKALGIEMNHLLFLKRRDPNLDDLLREQYDKNKRIPKEEYSCYRCHETLPKEKFHNSKRFLDGVSRTCKECSKAGQKKYYKIRYDKNINGDVYVSSKRCPKCMTTKSSEDFYKARGITDGLQAQCKTCQDKMHMERYLKLKNNRQEQTI